MQDGFVFREWIHLQGELKICAGECDNLAELTQLFAQINYFGKKGCFFQFLPDATQQTDAPTFTPDPSTSFKQGKNIQPFPLPELVFNGLLRRWNLFAPEALKFPNIEWNAVVSAYELKTYAMKMEGGAEIGAEGLVRYRFTDSEQARIATTLAHFANFAGIGRKTAMGMGQVKGG